MLNFSRVQQFPIWCKRFHSSLEWTALGDHYTLFNKTPLKNFKVLLFITIHFSGDCNSSSVHLKRMLRFLKEFSGDRILIIYVINDVWEYMASMEVCYFQKTSNEYTRCCYCHIPEKVLLLTGHYLIITKLKSTCCPFISLITF